MVCLADSEVLDGHVAKFSPMSWANKKLKRVCRSSLACEVQAGAEALEELEVLRLLYAEAVEGGLNLARLGGVSQQQRKVRFRCF